MNIDFRQNLMCKVKKTGESTSDVMSWHSYIFREFELVKIDCLGIHD